MKIQMGSNDVYDGRVCDYQLSFLSVKSVAFWRTGKDTKKCDAIA